MDVNPVFDPTIPVPQSAFVLTVSEGKQLLPPGTMRKHFAEHPEGKERVPKWSIAGPKWSIGPENGANGIELEPSRQQELLDNIVQYLETVVKKQPGFVSSTIHKSVDGTRVVNYAQWTSPEFFKVSINAQMRAFDPKIFQQVTPNGHMYEIYDQAVSST